MRPFAFALAVGLVGLSAWGCTSDQETPSASPDVEVYRSQYLLSQEPQNPLGVIAARETVTGDEHEHEHEGDEHAQEHEGEHDHHAHEHEGEEHAHDHDHDHAHDHSHAAEPKQVVVVGKIGGVSEPWDEGRAAFMIADPSDTAQHDAEHSHDHGHAHDGHDHDGHDHGAAHSCPFCERAKEGTRSLAIVQFVDQQGEILPIDARQLFDLEEGQTVVVRGPATIDALGNLVISAEGLYPRK